MILMSTPQRRTLLGAWVAVLLATTVGCGGAGNDGEEGRAEVSLPLFGGTVPADGPAIDLTPMRETAGRDVVMIGDSITVASTPALEAAADTLGVELRIYAEVGRRISVGGTPEAGVDVLEGAIDQGVPDLFVFALGTNDVGQYETEDEYAGEIDRILALVPDRIPVAWVNIYLTADLDESARFNAALLSELGSRGNATIARWSNVASEDGVLSDGIHPTDEGTVEFTDLVSTEIANWLG